MDPAHFEHVAKFIGEVLGGSAEYSSQHGGHAAMIRHYLGKRHIGAVAAALGASSPDVFRPSEQNTFAKTGRLQWINPRMASSRDLKEFAKELRSHLFGLVAFKCPHLPLTETLK
jgi:truncated hemoglobin YjbI